MKSGILRAMRWAALLCLAACGGETGVAIEIRSERPIDSVEVFIGHEQLCKEVEGESKDCEFGVAWLPNQIVPPGITYNTRGKPGDIEPRVEAVKVGDHFEVHLQALSDFADPRVIAFVGFSQGEPVAVARLVEYEHARIPTNSSERWVVNLTPAMLAGPSYFDAPRVGEPPWRVAVWGRDNVSDPATAARCAVVQEWHEGDFEWKGTFIVPDSDHDCDGVEPECDAYYYHVNERVDAANVSRCLARDEALTPTPCMLGSTTCRDDSSDDRTCSLSRADITCVPDAFCDACTDPFSLIPCAAYEMKTNDQIAHVECSLHSDPSTGDACEYFYSTIHLGVLLAGIDVRLGTNPLVPIADNGSIFTVDGVAMSIFLEGSSTIEVHVKNGTAPAGTSQLLVIGAYPFVQGGPKFLLPLKVKFDGAACPTSTFQSAMCTNINVASDSMLRCAMPIP
jgi:hypothetical protein